MCQVLGNLSLDSRQNLYADLLHAQAERDAGYQGRTGDEVLSDMRRVIADFKAQCQSDGEKNTL